MPAQVSLGYVLCVGHFIWNHILGISDSAVPIKVHILPFRDSFQKNTYNSRGTLSEFIFKGH